MTLVFRISKYPIVGWEVLLTETILNWERDDVDDGRVNEWKLRLPELCGNFHPKDI